MATCKECVHYEVCHAVKLAGEIKANVETLCKNFKDKSHFIELPFIAMIEQTIVNSKPNFTKSAASKNGMYCVVYFDPKKWGAPLIDICGKTHYRTDEANARILALKERKNNG